MIEDAAEVDVSGAVDRDVAHVPQRGRGCRTAVTAEAVGSRAGDGRDDAGRLVDAMHAIRIAARDIDVARRVDGDAVELGSEFRIDGGATFAGVREVEVAGRRFAGDGGQQPGGRE